MTRDVHHEGRCRPTKMTDRLRNPWVVGVGLPAVALGLQLLIWPWVQPFVWFLFYPAAFFAAWLGGRRAGLIATPLSALLVWYFFVPGRFSFESTEPSAAPTSAMFIVMGIAFAIALERVRRADARALDRAQSMLDNLFEQSLVGVALFNQTGDFLYVNPEWLHIFGYESSDELIGKLRNLDMIAPASRPQLKSIMQARIAGDEPHSAFTIEGQRRDGTSVWISAFGSAFELEGAMASLVVVFDISARVEAENELRAVTERFQVAEQAAAVGVWEWDVASGRLMWDDEMKWLYGLEPEDACPDFETWKSRLHPEDASRVSEVLDAAIAGRGPYDLRFRIQLPDGSIRHIQANGTVFRDVHGAPLRMVGANLDVTQEARAQTALAASETRFRAFMDSAPLVAWIQDEEGWILWVNRMFSAMWGDREYTKMKISDFQPTDVAVKLRTQDLQVMAGDGPIVRRNAANGPNGEPMYWHTARFAFKDANGRQVLGATSINVTGEVESHQKVSRLLETLERRVEQRTAELAAANQELESFSYAVSHDLRAPLRAMSGFASILREDYEGRLDDEADSHLTHIIEGSQQMSMLIDGLLQLSRTTQADLTRGCVDVSRLAEEVWAQVCLEHPDRHADFSVESGLVLYADPFMTQVVLRNLLGNASKYTSKCDSAEIRVIHAELEGEPAVSICDNGAGFDPAHANSLFEPFQRLHRQDEFPGVGIGLATCLRIVRRHRGAITATGELGKGACFTFSLGRAEPEHDAT